MAWVVIFCDETAPLPDDMSKLGCYMGLSMDVGPAITLKILTQVIHRSTYRPLTQDKIADKDGSDTSEQFMARVHENLGSWILPRELEDIEQENTPQYDLY